MLVTFQSVSSAKPSTYPRYKRQPRPVKSTSHVLHPPFPAISLCCECFDPKKKERKKESRNVNSSCFGHGPTHPLTSSVGSPLIYALWYHSPDPFPSLRFSSYGRRIRKRFEFHGPNAIIKSLMFSMSFLILNQGQNIQLRLDQALKLVPLNARRPGQQVQAANAARNVLLDAKLVLLLLAGGGFEPGDGV